MGRQLGKMRVLTQGACWKDTNVIAVKVGRHTDETLAYTTRLFLNKAIPSRAPHRYEALNEKVRTAGLTAAIASATLEAVNLAAIDIPELTTTLELLGIVGALVGPGAHSIPPSKTPLPTNAG